MRPKAITRVLNRPYSLVVSGLTALIISMTLACENSDTDVAPEVRDSSCERLCHAEYWRNVLVAAED